LEDEELDYEGLVGVGVAALLGVVSVRGLDYLAELLPVDSCVDFGESIS